MTYLIALIVVAILSGCGYFVVVAVRNMRRDVP